MTEPTLESMNEAAQAATDQEWEYARRHANPLTALSIRAHALTLDELHGRKELSEAAEFWAQLWEVRDVPTVAKGIRNGNLDDLDRKAIALIEAKFAELRAPKEPAWIEWHGGECPVAPGTRVEVALRSGQRTSKFRAGTWNWKNLANDGDIMFYRVL